MLELPNEICEFYIYGFMSHCSFVSCIRLVARLCIVSTSRFQCNNLLILVHTCSYWLSWTSAQWRVPLALQIILELTLAISVTFVGSLFVFSLDSPAYGVHSSPNHLVGQLVELNI